MIIKEAPWEKRNLNVNAVEFYLEQNEGETLGDSVLNDQVHDYQVAHVPIKNINAIKKLSTNGFYFIETKLYLTASLKELTLPKVFTRFVDSMSYREAKSSADIQSIYDSIKNGVFDTDKIALDEKFSLEASAHRYYCWAKDEIEKGTSLPYLVQVDGVDIGFFILKIDGRIADSFLAGLFDNSASSGLGFSTLYFPMLEANKKGCTKIVTGVSSNNIDSVKTHLSLGYRIKELEYIFIKHI